MPEAATRFTSVDLLQAIGAVAALVSVKPFSTSVTPVVPFLTLIEPSEHEPETIYVPAPLMVSSVPSIL